MKRIPNVKSIPTFGLRTHRRCFRAGSAVAAESEPKEAKLTVFSKDLTDLPGKEGLMLLIEYPPGSTDPIDRHNAHGFIYVLEGSIVMQVRGGKEVTLTPGRFSTKAPRMFTSSGETPCFVNARKYGVASGRSVYAHA